MSDWHECPNAQECTEGNRFGKGCVVDPAQSAMGGKPWHECHCGVDSDGNPPNLRQADEITRLRAEVVQASQQLGDILAIIHRDGGHHTADVGIEQSVKDAHIKWANLMTENERLRAALEEIEYLDRPQSRGLPRRISIEKIARAALEGT